MQAAPGNLGFRIGDGQDKPAVLIADGFVVIAVPAPVDFRSGGLVAGKVVHGARQRHRLAGKR